MLAYADGDMEAFETLSVPKEYKDLILMWVNVSPKQVR